MKQKKRLQQVMIDIQLVDSEGCPLPPNAQIKELSPGVRRFLDAIVQQMVEEDINALKEGREPRFGVKSGQQRKSMLKLKLRSTETAISRQEAPV